MNTLIKDLYEYANFNDKISLRKLQFISNLDIYQDALASAVETIANGETENYVELLELKDSMGIRKRNFTVSPMDIEIISLIAEKGKEATLEELYRLAEKYTSLRKIWEDILSFIEIEQLYITKKEYEEIKQKLPDNPATESMINLWCGLAEIHGYLKKVGDKKYSMTKEGGYILIIAKYIVNNLWIPSFYDYLLIKSGREVEAMAAKKLLTLKPV